MLDMSSWVQEKVIHVLGALAGIADIAKDPETPSWYKRNLRRYLGLGFEDGLKVLLWSHGRPDDWQPDLRTLPTEHGTLGLAKLLNQLNVSHDLSVERPSVDLDDDEGRDPPNPPGVPPKMDDPWSSPLRQGVMRQVPLRLADRGRELGDAEARLFAWIAYHVATSDYADIGLLTAELLFSDVGLSKQEGEAALQALVARRFIEMVPELRFVENRRLPIRIIVEGLNDRRHEPIRD